MAVYFIKVALLEPFQLVILGTIFEVTIFLCEVPTGVVADVISRRLSVVLGYLTIGVAFLITGFFPVFWILAIGACVWGLGETFISGAREAWIADELIADGSKIPAEKAFVSGSQFQLFGRILGTWFSVAVALHGLSTPIIVGALGQIAIGILFAMIAPEHGFQRKNEKHSLGAVLDTFKAGIKIVRSKVALVTIVLTTFFIGFSSEAFDRLWQNHLLDLKLPQVFGREEIWWAVLNSGAMLGSVILLQFIRRKENLASTMRLVGTVLTLIVIVAVGMTAFGLAPNAWWAIGCFFIVRTVRRAIDPLLTTWLNRRAESNVRATLLSFSGQAHSLGEILSGPVLGTIAQTFTLRASLVTSSFLLAPVLPLIVSRLRHVRAEEARDAAPATADG